MSRDLRLQVILSAVDKFTKPFKSAQASNKKLAESLRQSRQQLKQLNQASGQLKTFQSLSNKTKELSGALNQAKLKAQMMGMELSNITNPTKKQTAALEKQWATVSKLEDSYKSNSVQMNRIRADLYKIGISSQNAEQATAKIRRETERYTAKLHEQEQQLKRVASQEKRIAMAKGSYQKTLDVRNKIAVSGAAMTASGIAISLPAISAIKQYSKLEDAMKGVAKQVNSLRDNKGNRTLKYAELEHEIKRLSEELPIDGGASSIAALIEGGARMGVINDNDPWLKQKADLIAFAKVSAMASKAFELPAEQLAEDLGKIAFLYKVPMQNIEELGDVLNYLDDKAQSKGADIINVMQRMGDVADKLDFKQAAALGSTFLSLGAAPEVAASASKAMIRELGIASMQSKRFTAGMETLGLNAQSLEKGIANNTIQTITDVLSRIKKLSKDKQLSVMTMLFGKQFGDDAQKLGLNIDEFIRQLALTQKIDARGSMKRESDIDTDSISAQWLLLKTGTENAFSSIGSQLRKPVIEFMGYLKTTLGWVRRWIEQNSELTKTIAKIALVVGGLLTILGTLAVAISAIIGPIALVKLSLSVLGIRGAGFLSMLLNPLKLVGSAILWLGNLLLANPIILIITAIAGAAYLIYKYWNDMVPFFSSMWQSISRFFSQAWDNIAQYTAEKWQLIKNGISNKWDEVINDIKSVGIKLKLIGGQIIDSLKEGIMEKWEALKSKFAEIKRMATDLLPDWMISKSPPTPATSSITRNVKSAGLFDTGGYIPRGQFGIAGEHGPEIVNGPARVMSRRHTAALAAAALSFGSINASADKPIHPFALAANDYRSASKTINQNQTQASSQSIVINIHAAPHQSAQDIGREVAKQLEQQQRRAQARKLSHYQDSEEY